MSMNRCFKCGDIYDTDYQMEEIDDEMVCDNCYDEMKQREKCEEDLIHEIMDSEMWSQINKRMFVGINNSMPRKLAKAILDNFELKEKEKKKDQRQY